MANLNAPKKNKKTKNILVIIWLAILLLTIQPTANFAGSYILSLHKTTPNIQKDNVKAIDLSDKMAPNLSASNEKFNIFSLYAETKHITTAQELNTIISAAGE